MVGSPVHRVSAGDAWSRSMHPDIESERHSQSFNVEELTNILDGGARTLHSGRKVGKSRLGNGAPAFCPRVFLGRRVPS